MTDQERIQSLLSNQTDSTAHIESGAIFDADVRNTSPVIQKLAEDCSIEDLLNLAGSHE